MGSKKEKTPEKKLVDDIWEEIKLVLANTSEKVELNRIVESAWKSGASCDEIQRVFEENLPKYQRKPDEEIERLKLASVPFTRKDKQIIFGFLAILAAVAVIAIITTVNTETEYYEVSVDGISFHVPTYFLLTYSGEDSDYAYQEFEYVSENNNDSTTTYFFDIIVFKDRTVEQALSYWEFGDRWKINRDITYGDYTGIRVDIIVMPFRNTSPNWFIFEKDGKAVAIYLEHEGTFNNCMDIIIN